MTTTTTTAFAAGSAAYKNGETRAYPVLPTAGAMPGSKESTEWAYFARQWYSGYDAACLADETR